MPRFDGTGPNGFGPQTGRGMGTCGSGFARGRGFGFGRGFGRFWSKKNEVSALEEEEKIMKDELEAIREEIKALQEEK